MGFEAERAAILSNALDRMSRAMFGKTSTVAPAAAVGKGAEPGISQRDDQFEVMNGKYLDNSDLVQSVD